MSVHFVEPIPQNLTGSFCRDDEPILMIQSGDTVVFRTLDASWQTKARTSIDDAPEYVGNEVDLEKRGTVIASVALSRSKVLVPG